MKTRELKMTFSLPPRDDAFVADIWAQCTTREECELLIEWLQLAKWNMTRWEALRAKASRAAKAAASKDETAKRREIQGAPRQQIGAHGVDQGEAADRQ